MLKSRGNDTPYRMPAPHSHLARLGAFATVLMLAACAHRAVTTTHYVPPTPFVPPPPTQDSAPMAMRGNVPAGSFYTVNVFADTPGCSGSQRVGSSRGETDLPATALATERWQTLQVDIDEPAKNRRCTVRVSFTPRHGRSYLLAPKLANDRCNAYVFDATEPTLTSQHDGTAVRGRASNWPASRRGAAESAYSQPWIGSSVL